MAKDNMTVCKSCGAEIAKSAKTCPHCGAKNKKPIYKRPWFIVIVALIVIGVAASALGGGDDSGNSSTPSDGSDKTATEEKKIEYTKASADDLMKDLEENAANASDKYKDQYLAVEGKLGTIDSDGSYFEVLPANDEWAILGITCRIQDDKQLEKVKKLKKDDIVIVKGQIIEVGEIMSYTMRLDSVKAKD